MGREQDCPGGCFDSAPGSLLLRPNTIMLAIAIIALLVMLKVAIATFALLVIFKVLGIELYGVREQISSYLAHTRGKVCVAQVRAGSWIHSRMLSTARRTSTASLMRCAYGGLRALRPN